MPDFGDFSGAFDDGRRPAAAASIMQIILGCLLLLFSALLAVMYRMRGVADIVEDMQRRGISVPGQDLTEVVALGVVVLGGGAVVLGIALVVLGIFVRRGSRGAAMTSIVLRGLVALVCLMTLAGGWSQSGAIVLVLMYGSVLGLCLATIANLLRALRAWRDRQSLAAMQQAWLMMRQPPVSPYGHGYGYGSAPDQSSGPSPPAPSSPA